MPRAAILLLLAVLAPSMDAATPEPAHPLTVAELDQMLAGMRKENDGKAARQIAGLRLAERAGASDLARWEAELPGLHTNEALIALVDASEFLRPPAAEILATAPPNAPDDKQIIARAVEFVKETLPKLPNFYAVRSTTSFEVATEGQLAPFQLMPGSLKTNQPKKSSYHALGPAGLSGLANQNLYWTGAYAKTVTYRDGAEVDDAQGGSTGESTLSEENLTTWGEFGPILRVVLEDAPTDKTVLDRWEKSTHGPLAVFRYSVPRARSHVAMRLSSDAQNEYPAYDGEFAVDPETGAIYRITIRAAESGMGFVARTYIAVEFGPTEIAGVDYVCPVRSVAIAKDFDPLADEDAHPETLPFRTTINEITFTKYHVFRTNARIVP